MEAAPSPQRRRVLALVLVVGSCIIRRLRFYAGFTALFKNLCTVLSIDD